MNNKKSKKIPTKRKYTKKNTTTAIEVSSVEEIVPEQEVYDMLKFASSFFNGVYTPQLVNQRMQDIGLSPLIATSKDIDTALQNPKSNEDTLIGYNEFLELTSMLFKRTLFYLSGMLSFDYTYYSSNAEESDFGTAAYKKDIKIVSDFLNRFDVKREFGTVVRQMLRTETFFSVLRTDTERYTLQELNHNYCIITGRWDYGLMFDFNMYYFLQPGVDIDLFPTVFKSMFNRTLGNNPKYKDYNPANRDGSWVLWAQTSPKDGFWSFKLNPEMASRIPFLAPMFPDVVLQPIIRQLQTNSYIAAANKILIGEIPLLSKDVKGGVQKDSVAVSPDLLGKFLALLKSGLSDVIKVGAAPLQNMAGITFPLDKPFYEDYLKTTTATSGINSRLLFTLDKNNSTESQLSINVDEYLMEHIYPYFSDFLEYQINQRTKKFKFKFIFEGTNFFTNRKERLDRQMQLLPFGIVNYQKIAAAIGQAPDVFLKQLAMTKSLKFVDGLTPIQMAAQLPGDSKSGTPNTEDKGGRPSKPLSELSDSGVQTIDDASNQDKND